MSSNPWDAVGANAAGFKVPGSRGEGLPQGRHDCPLTMFKALWRQMDELDLTPDYTINGLSGLTQILAID